MDKTVHGGHAPGFFHFRVGSVRTADAYIIRHGAAEQNGILGNQRYVGKKILLPISRTSMPSTSTLPERTS